MAGARADKNWTLTTTATTADQSIGSHTPANKKVLNIEAIVIEVSLTTPSTTEVVLGTITIRWNSIAIITVRAINPSSAAPFGLVIPLRDFEVNGDASKALDAICTPAAVTSTKWRVGIIAHEGV